MAFRAELLRRQWYCICGFNAINWYKEKLYKEWYDSLTPEQIERLKEEKEKRRLESEQSLINLFLGYSSILAMLYSKRIR